MLKVCRTKKAQGAWNVNEHFKKLRVNFSLNQVKHTYNTSLWVPLAAVAERGGQGGGAAFVVQGRASIIDGRVDGDCPHARGVAIAIAVVIATAIS